MNEGHGPDRPAAVEDAARYRIRTGDVLQGIGLATFLALGGLLLTSFRDNLNNVWGQLGKHVEQDIAAHEKLDARIRELEMKRRR